MSLVSVRPASSPPVGQFELDMLELLPCGCVAAVHQARPSHVMVVSLEAKGPHCTLPGHRPNEVLGLGDPSEWSTDEEPSDEEPA